MGLEKGHLHSGNLALPLSHQCFAHLPINNGPALFMLLDRFSPFDEGEPEAVVDWQDDDKGGGFTVFSHMIEVTLNDRLGHRIRVKCEYGVRGIAFDDVY